MMKNVKKKKKGKPTEEMGQKSHWGSVKPDNLEFDKQAGKKKGNFINIMRKTFWNNALDFHAIFSLVRLHGLKEKSDFELIAVHSQ